MSRGIECAAAIIGEVKKAVIGKDECIIGGDVTGTDR